MKNTEDKFKFRKITKDDMKQTADIDFGKLYESAHNELSLQQTKRDQIITLYIAVFSLLIPFAFSIESLTLLEKGLIFLVVGVIGIFFTMISVRYRVYKEVYWLCCETITCLINIKQERLNKETVQNVFYESMRKKGSSYVVKKSSGKKKWNTLKYVRKNLFSSETMHFVIIDLMTSILLGLSAFLIFPLELSIAIAVAVAVGLAAFLILLTVYFACCINVYAVLTDETDASFNRTFTKAWFLHFYIDTEE